jgi:KDO2-lipid IV(A) lauroyltransferase
LLMVSALLYKFGASLALHLPKTLTAFITILLADLQYITRFKLRRIVSNNLRIVHGDSLTEQELRKKTRSVFRSFAKSIYLFLRSPLLTIEDLKSVGNADDFMAMTEDLKTSGFIIVTGHLGPWEVGGLWLAANGFKVNTVALDHPAEDVTAFFNQRREHSGLKIFPHRDSFHNLEDALLQGECVALLADRDYGSASERARFFGHEVNLPIGHILLSIRTGKPIIVGAFVFDSQGGFTCEIKGLYHPDSSMEEKDAIEYLHVKCLRDFESLIEAHSDQWFQFIPIIPDGKK